ncbi:TerD family protein [Blastococcus sp. CT_GayMR16]|uniref:TerD family protein n=1 Tax=Blastococcus sp. CT_GayMR16 TaxID=2559607 RepID=UPI001073F38D|nr:TerD family protein [Blastococcus sp. CT_GayMR16]TFV87396.1 TerD family protein [Blastococcus sp. CT_GayMR16]
MVGAELSKGQNAPLPSEVLRLRVVVTWDQADEDVDVDASALLLDDAGRVRSDEDFVFYNQPVSSDGSVQYLGRGSTETGSQESLALDLESLPQDITSVAVTASVGAGTFGALEGLRLLVLDPAGTPLASYAVAGAAEETALLFGEIYRRGDGWKVRAVGQGWSSGLAGLAQDFGVTVADDASQTPEAPVEPVTEAPEVLEVLSEAESNELVDVVELESDSPDEALAVVIDLPAPKLTLVEQPAEAAVPASAAGRPSAKGVRTRKQSAVKATAPALRLAVDESWTAARLFSIVGVGNAEEQERRATSALLATMMAVRPLGRGITARLGAPAGTLETYLEVPFPRGEGVVIPDGVIRIARGSRVWTGLLETKTGSGQLRRDQVENYLDVARQQGFDAVITLSNEIAPAAGEHPVEVDRRKLAKVALFHLSWAEVLHEAQMVLAHRGVDDQLQAWLLHEFVRYLQHPRSGAAGFDDMGGSWVPVREAVAAGTLRAGDRKVPAVVDAWIRLVRQLSLRLTAELGVNVAHVLPRKLATDPVTRTRVGVEALVETGCLSATLKVPGAAGPVTAIADLRTGQVRVSTKVPAPEEGTAQRRITWLLRQLKEAPDDLLIDVAFANAESTCELLRDVRDKPAALIASSKAEVASFTLTRSLPLGTKRSGVRGAFIPSVVHAVEGFYTDVLQPLRPWVARAPQMPEGAAMAQPEVLESVPAEADAVG